MEIYTVFLIVKLPVIEEKIQYSKCLLMKLS